MASCKHRVISTSQINLQERKKGQFVEMLLLVSLCPICIYQLSSEVYVAASIKSVFSVTAEGCYTPIHSVWTCQTALLTAALWVR